ncbi:MAG: PAS domain S-box protein, partial [Deltaproteobacteria bacterium]|nr:PAS domain S-box protein [Deltaproteobacteria bacterium]
MPQPRVLLTGAAPEEMESLASLLAGGGYRVERCPAEEAWDCCQASLPDLLLIVDQAPFTGELLRRLRGHPATGQIPVLVALTRFTESAAAQVLGWGADEFLVPPFQPQEVLARVAVLLKLHRDRRMLLSSREDFTRLFRENPQPLFYCDRQGERCHLNPALRRLLGYPDQEDTPVAADHLLYREEDRLRFQQLLSETPPEGHIKLKLRSRAGQPVIVLVNDLARNQAGAHSFQVQQVGPVSPLKKALKTLVENFLPAARDYLALLSMTPLLGGRYE